MKATSHGLVDPNPTEHEAHADLHSRRLFGEGRREGKWLENGVSSASQGCPQALPGPWSTKLVH